MKKWMMAGAVSLLVLVAVPLFSYAAFASTDPVLKMPFEGNLVDESIYHNNGVLNGTTPPAFVAGRKGQCLSFNGLDDSYVRIADADSLDFGVGDFSISFWLKPTSGDGSFIQKMQGYAGYSLSLTSKSLQLWIKDANNKIGVFYPATQVNGSTFTQPNIVDGKWHHVVVTVDRDNVNGVVFYIDNVRVPYTVLGTGQVKITEVNASISNTIPLYLGCHHYQSGWDYKGLMDDLLMVQRVLNASEVAQLYQGASPVFKMSFENNLVDDSIYHNNGMMSGSNPPVFVSGQSGMGLSFNGQTNSFVRVPDANALDIGTGDFSFTLWFKTSNTKANNTIFDKRAVSSPGYHFTLYDGAPCLQLVNSSTYNNYWPGYNATHYNDGKWHFLEVSVDRDSTTGLKFYIDKALVYTGNPQLVPGNISNSADLSIGKHNETQSYNFEGQLDEVIFYNQALY